MRAPKNRQNIWSVVRQEVSKQSVDRQKIAVEKKAEDSGKLEEQLEDILGNI